MNPLQFLPEHGLSSLSGCWRTKDPRLVWERLCYMGLKRFRPFTTKWGYRIENVQQLVSWWELAHEQRIWQWWQDKVFSGATILDIGSNFGIFGFMARRKFPNCKIIGVEPHPECASFCHGLGIYNGFHNVALTPETGPLCLQMADNDGFTGSTIPCYDTKANVPVLGRRLDQLGVAADFIKVDVDGAELEVVKSGPKVFRDAKACVIETVFNWRVDKIANLIGKRMTHRLTSIDYLFQ